ncbi:MAG: hypothetical protein NZ805_06140 [Armatimonadetes bacterium]|nr:hypothetical protein [Armatimonadota bacterium]MDW8027680.1 hypothetical protein [Armatimonadota bacterium]
MGVLLHNFLKSLGFLLNFNCTLAVTELLDEKASGIFSGFNASFTYNSEWIMTTMEIWSQKWSDELGFIRQML